MEKRRNEMNRLTTIETREMNRLLKSPRPIGADGMDRLMRLLDKFHGRKSDPRHWSVIRDEVVARTINAVVQTKSS
jgi:hypothetical protein